ncbi:MAG TPA: adenylate/guanylate cyclase domain-containing protein [Burkholderiales bacterium]|nr:adenylate/guanylate cyclase domain-containing protein [Burkholderiales bacterium]
MDGRIPFRVAIVTVVVGLLAVTCGALIAYGLYTNQRNYEILKRQYIDQVAQAAVREVERVPRSAVQLLRIERQRFASGEYAGRDPVALAGTLAAALQADRDMQWVSYGEATGRFAGARRLNGNDIVLNVSDPRRDGGIPREFRAGTLDPYVQSPPLKPYDPRTRGWYQRAVETPEAIVWMPPYTFAEGVTGITAAAAVRDGARVQGVLTVDFTLTGIERVLSTIEVTGGAVTLFDHAGNLLAGAPGSAREAAILAMQGAQSGIVVAGERWELATRALTPGAGPDWMVVATMREEAFMGPVYANRRAAIAIILAGVAVSIVVGTLIANAIARSLENATRALDRVAKYQLEDPAPPRSVLREVFRLQRAVRRVTASLRSFARYAPEEIVRDVVATGREAILSGNRRDVTVLFSDLRGFTKFAEKLPPEEVVAILNDHFELLVAILARHGGFVVDFLGDAVFAVFGAPEPHSDHAERAVACGIEMQRARAARSEEYRARGWPPMEMGVGIDTGAAVVGNMGSLRRIKYGVVGHVVNAAARIETFTVGGQVLVSEATRRSLGDRLVAEGPLEVEAKGVSAPLRVWEVLALRGETTRVLPEPVRDLAVLHPPLEAGLRLIHGKHVDAEVHPARLQRLGAAGAELESKAPLAMFDALQLVLSTQPALTLDGKVVELAENDGVARTLIRFTGVDWDTQARIEALAREKSRRGYDAASKP